MQMFAMVNATGALTPALVPGTGIPSREKKEDAGAGALVRNAYHCDGKLKFTLIWVSASIGSPLR